MTATIQNSLTNLESKTPQTLLTRSAVREEILGPGPLHAQVLSLDLTSPTARRDSHFHGWADWKYEKNMMTPASDLLANPGRCLKNLALKQFVFPFPWPHVTSCLPPSTTAWICWMFPDDGICTSIQRAACYCWVFLSIAPWALWDAGGNKQKGQN